MPILSVSPDDMPHLNRQLDEFQTVCQMLDKLALEARALGAALERGACWSKNTSSDLEDLEKFLRLQRVAIYRIAQRISVVSQSFEETWDVGESIRRALHKKQSAVGPIDLTVNNVLIGLAPSDDEIKDLLDG